MRRVRAIEKDRQTMLGEGERGRKREKERDEVYTTSSSVIMIIKIIVTSASRQSAERREREETCVWVEKPELFMKCARKRAEAYVCARSI